jgi:hypothetical protein
VNGDLSCCLACLTGAASNGDGHAARLTRSEAAALQQKNDRLNGATIFDDPWLLSREHPAFPKAPANEFQAEVGPINRDFEGKTAAQSLKWLRDALAHGDGRSILPLHKPSVRYDKTWLAGFKIAFNELKDSPRILTLHLYHSDMIRIGRALADDFCRELGRVEEGFERRAAHVMEAAE